MATVSVILKRDTLPDVYIKDGDVREHSPVLCAQFVSLHMKGFLRKLWWYLSGCDCVPEKIRLTLTSEDPKHPDYTLLWVQKVYSGKYGLPPRFQWGEDVSITEDRRMDNYGISRKTYMEMDALLSQVFPDMKWMDVAPLWVNIEEVKKIQ